MTRIPESVAITSIVIVFVACLIGVAVDHIRRERAKRALIGFRVRVRDNLLVQEDTKGRRVAFIDLNAPFKVTIEHRGSAEGIYSVTQEEQILGFSSAIPNAEHLVRDKLQCEEWPPEASWNVPR
jgi:hypothetical protein